ncbi:MAG: hypothetical protein ACLU37_11165 [Collinsella sp.]
MDVTNCATRLRVNVRTRASLRPRLPQGDRYAWLVVQGQSIQVIIGLTSRRFARSSRVF